MFSRELLRGVQRGCFVAGGVALCWCALAYGEMALFQARELREFEAVSRAGATSAAPLKARLVVPRINLSAMVVTGDDEKTLRRAVGHIPGTAVPGRPGTVGLAGHRDTFFRSLGRLQRNDEILLETGTGTYRYAIVSARAVEPEDTGVLRPTARPSLVLVTCYPFSFVGNAPQRYIVTAREVAER